MTAWVHKECDIMDEQAITTLQDEWKSSDQKDECTVRMDEEEWAYWMGTAAAHGLSAVCDVCVAAVVRTLCLDFVQHAASDTPRAAAAGKDLDARCGLRIGV